MVYEDFSLITPYVHIIPTERVSGLFWVIWGSGVKENLPAELRGSDHLHLKKRNLLVWWASSRDLPQQLSEKVDSEYKKNIIFPFAFANSL